MTKQATASLASGSSNQTKPRFFFVAADASTREPTKLCVTFAKPRSTKTPMRVGWQIVVLLSRSRILTRLFGPREKKQFPIDFPRSINQRNRWVAFGSAAPIFRQSLRGETIPQRSLPRFSCCITSALFARFQRR